MPEPDLAPVAARTGGDGPVNRTACERAADDTGTGAEDSLADDLAANDGTADATGDQAGRTVGAAAILARIMRAAALERVGMITARGVRARRRHDGRNGAGCDHSGCGCNHRKRTHKIFLKMFRQANRRSALMVAQTTMNRVWPSV